MNGPIQRLWRGYAPNWFQARWISTFFDSLAVLLDGEAQRVIDGRLAAIPYAGAGPGAAKLATGARIECEPDALIWHANDRGIPIYETEPLWSKRKRIADWHRIHEWHGQHQGCLRNVQPYYLGADGLGVLPDLHIVHQSGAVAPDATWHKLDASGVYTRTLAHPSNFNFDNQGVDSQVPIAPAWAGATEYLVGEERTNDGGKLYVCIDPGTSAGSGGPTGTSQDITDGGVHWRNAKPWARYWAFIDMTPLVAAGLVTAPDAYGDGSLYGDGSVYGGGVSTQAAADLVSMFSWKAAHSALWGVGLLWTPGVLDPAGTPTQDAEGRWSLPNGKWGRLIDVGTGLATRPNGIQWIYDRSQG